MLNDLINVDYKQTLSLYINILTGLQYMNI